MDRLIFEFFNEVIRRIVPGLVLITLYWHKQVVTLLYAHHDFCIFIIAGVIAVAWLLGLMAEEGTSLIADLLWRLGGGRVFTVVRKWFYKDENGCPKRLIISDKEDGPGNRAIDKMNFAEREMSRSLVPIFIVTRFCPPEPFSFLNTVRISWHPYFGILAAIIFLFTWLWASIKERLVLPVTASSYEI